MTQKNIHFTQVIKINGDRETFSFEKIELSIWKAAQKVGGKNESLSKRLAVDVLHQLKKTFPKQKILYTRDIGDAVEKILIEHGHAKTAKEFILYRDEQNKKHQQGLRVTEETRKKFLESKKFFRNPLAELVFYRTYSRWIDKLSRRETWPETVARYMDFMEETLGTKISQKDYDEVHQAMLKQEVIPSMRLLWTAGDAARRSHVCAYNCSFIAPESFQDLAEILYLLLSGVGVGFSVETHVAQQFPIIKKQRNKPSKKYVIKDTREGWCDALSYGLTHWFDGYDVEFDYTKIRPAGSILRTMGGRAAGPKPLTDLLKFCRSKILANQNRRLSNLDMHDIICKIGEIVKAGGVIRSALISLSDLDDIEMREAKNGQFWLTNPQRGMANNSAVYQEKPTALEFLKEWVSLMESRTGERGIFNRGGLEAQLPKRRWQTFQNYYETSGTNPCGEIILRHKQFCNLTSVAVRAEDTVEELNRKIKIATILGTFQASLTNFPYLSKEWAENCREEALLGVSITGYWDNPRLQKADVLKKLRDESVKVNHQYAKKIGINPSTSVTCIKPSGNSGLLLDTASGMHPRYAPYYVRRVRLNANDPVFRTLKDSGVSYHPEVGQSLDDATTFVVEFPVKSPKSAVTREDVRAIDMLEHWKLLKENFTEHNPSVTIYVGRDEWIDVGQWVFANWEIIGGVSFLPRTDHIYQLAPYEECTKEEYEALKEKTKDIDFSKIILYELEDMTEGAKQLACMSGSCEL